jgi:hypothetical protein
MSGNLGLEGWQGWRQNQGWTQGWHQGWQQGSAGVDQGLDGAAVEGLIRNREALLAGIPPAAAVASANPAVAGHSTAARAATAVEHPKLDQPNELAVCGPDVRMKVLILELLQDLHFSAKDEAARVTLGGADGAPLLAQIVRPPAGVFQQQAAEVGKWAARRAERAPEILSQVGPQMAYWSAIVNLSPERTPKTLEFCHAAMTFASFVVQRVKHILSCKRPLAYDRTLQPMILTPAFSAMPSGHATEAFMMAHLLTQLCKPGKADALLLQRQAERIATNRVIAGLHFPVDSIAGRMLGQTLAEYLLHRSIGKPWTARSFLGPEVAGNAAFKYDEPMDTQAPDHFKSEPGTAVDLSLNLKWLWDRCQRGNA